jgi:predicted ATPase
VISSIILTNFKCFERLDLNIKPLSLLCGPNGMGKSSVIQALLVLRQSYLSGELTSGRLVLSGDLADLGTGADLLFEDAAVDVLGFELVWTDKSDSRRWSIAFQYEREADRLQALPQRQHRPPSYVPVQERKRPPFGGQFVYLNAERIGPRKTHMLSETKARSCDLGPKGEFVLNYLHSEARTPVAEADLRTKKTVPLQLGPQVDAWLQEVTPGVHLELEPIRAADAVIGGFVFDREGDVASRRYRATNVGFGLSYVLPIIVALMATRARGLVLLENPEAHIHPRGQTKLGELAARAAAGGVQVLVETHSDHFMDGVRIAVRDGLVMPGEVSFHYFDRSGAGLKQRFGESRVDLMAYGRTPWS